MVYIQGNRGMWKKPGSQKDTGEGKPREFIIYETGVLRHIKKRDLSQLMTFTATLLILMVSSFYM